MQITDLLSQSGGISSIARELGISDAQAQTAAMALLPAIIGGFAKHAQAQPAGMAGVGNLLGQLGGGGLLDNVLSPQPTDIGQGNNVLGRIFGSKDVSRTVAQHAAAQTGLEPTLLKKMLPMLALLAVGYMAKKHGQAAVAKAQGHDAGTAPAAPAPDARTNGGLGGLGGLLGGLFGNQSGGLGGLASKLDTDGNGNPLDDILRKAGMIPR